MDIVALNISPKMLNKLICNNFWISTAVNLTTFALQLKFRPPALPECRIVLKHKSIVQIIGIGLNFRLNFFFLSNLFTILTYKIVF